MFKALGDEAVTHLCLAPIFRAPVLRVALAHIYGVATSWQTERNSPEGQCLGWSKTVLMTTTSNRDYVPVKYNTEGSADWYRQCQEYILMTHSGLQLSRWWHEFYVSKAPRIPEMITPWLCSFILNNKASRLRHRRDVSAVEQSRISERLQPWNRFPQNERTDRVARGKSRLDPHTSIPSMSSP